MNHTLLMTGALALMLTACGSSSVDSPVPTDNSSRSLPADHFDLSHWNITVPLDQNSDGKVDTVKVADIQSFSHPNFFYANADGNIVFASPNKALTTPNSSNTRSELRYMSRGSNTKLKTASPGNNFALRAHPDADSFASIGGRMEATVTVDHVARRAGNPDRPAAYSAVIGQIHALSLIHISEPTRPY